MRDDAEAAPACRCAMTAAGAIAIRRTRRRAWRRSIRLKAPQNGQTVIQDAVQGEVKVENAQLDDMILLRADGTPTYMHAVVVDDHDMGITHVIRGDDHLNNAFRQLQIIKAMGWPEPVYAHIPLIHGRRRRQAQQAPRRARRRCLSRHGLPARGAAQLPAAAGLGPWRRRDHLDQAGDRVVRPAGRRPLGLALRHGEAHQPQRALSARGARRRAAAAGAAAHRAEARPRHRRRRHGAHRARHEWREAALAHGDRARRQPRLLCQRRRPADRRRQGARPAHARQQGAARPARGRLRAASTTGARSRSRRPCAASPRPRT